MCCLCVNVYCTTATGGGGGGVNPTAVNKYEYIKAGSYLDSWIWSATLLPEITSGLINGGMCNFMTDNGP
jgi:hypothetical protein